MSTVFLTDNDELQGLSFLNLDFNLLFWISASPIMGVLESPPMGVGSFANTNHDNHVFSPYYLCNFFFLIQPRRSTTALVNV